MTYLVNLSEKDYIRKKNKWFALPSPFTRVLMALFRLPKIKAWIDTNNPGDPLIPFSVSLEERLLKLSDDDREAELKNIGTQSALGKITQAGYSSLDVRPTPLLGKRGRSDSLSKLIRYFTCGPDEVRAWTIRKGIKAPQAAGVIQYVSTVFHRIVLLLTFGQFGLREQVCLR